MKQGKSILAFLLAIFLMVSSFSETVLASSPVITSNVQTNSFPGFRNDWNAGSGFFNVTGSGPVGGTVRLISTGDQIHLEVPNTAFRGEFEIIVRHGNQFSITTITITGAVTTWELVGIGVGNSNAVSQVMIGEYRFEQDEEGNPILITPPIEEDCEEDENDGDDEDEDDGDAEDADEDEDKVCEDEDENGEDNEDEDEDDEEEHCDETFYHLNPDGMTPTAPIVDRDRNRDEEVEPELEVEADNPESEEKVHYEYCEDVEADEYIGVEIEVEIYIPILPQTSVSSISAFFVGTTLLGVAGFLLKLKKFKNN